MNNNNFPLVVCLATPERKANYQWFEGSIALKDPNIKIETLEDEGTVKVAREKDME